MNEKHLIFIQFTLLSLSLIRGNNWIYINTYIWKERGTTNLNCRRCQTCMKGTRNVTPFPQFRWNEFCEKNYMRLKFLIMLSSSVYTFFFSPFAPHSQHIHLPCIHSTRRFWRIALLPSEQYPQHQCILMRILECAHTHSGPHLQKWKKKKNCTWAVF